MAKPKINKSGKKKIKIKYVIPDQLIDCYVNGVYGGVTPRQEIHMHVFSERNPIPEEVTIEFGKKGEERKEIEKVIGGDVVRIVQASLIMDYETAIAIRNWLNGAINHIEGLDKKEKPKTDEEKVKKAKIKPKKAAKKR